MIPITRPDLPPLEDYHALLEQIWKSRMLSNFAAFSQRLESIATEYLGSPVQAVVSGDVGLILAIKALRLPRGARVVVPSFTFSSTVNSVLWNGLRPVFADIDRRSLNLDPASADEAAERYGAQLILATHVFGNPASGAELAKVAERHRARLVFDAAHAYGSEYDGQKVGGLGDAEVFSLSGTKLVTSAEGGLIASRDPGIAARIRLLRGYGFHGDYDTQYVGMNGKMSELHAALGTLTLAKVEEAVGARRRLADAYQARLAGSAVSFQVVRPVDRSTCKDFFVLFNTAAARERAEQALAEAQIQTKRYFLPCHLQRAYHRIARLPLPVTESVADRGLCLPIFADLTLAQVDRITDIIGS